jgi:hypothetical protein
LPFSAASGLVCVVGVEQSSTLEPAQHSQLDRMTDCVKMGCVGNGELMKDDTLRSWGHAAKDSIRHGDVIVHIEVEVAAEALGKTHGAAADAGRARSLCLCACTSDAPNCSRCQRQISLTKMRPNALSAAALRAKSKRNSKGTISTHCRMGTS